MPFIITSAQPHSDKMFAQQQPDGCILWVAGKRNATIFSEAAADKIAADINAYASTPVEVEGIKVEQPA